MRGLISLYYFLKKQKPFRGAKELLSKMKNLKLTVVRDYDGLHHTWHSSWHSSTMCMWCFRFRLVTNYTFSC